MDPSKHSPGRGPSSRCPRSWVLPHGSLLLAAGCCLTIRCSWRLAAAPWLAALGGWLQPHGSFLLAGCCPTVHCCWRLAAAHDSLLLATGCFPVIFQFLSAPLPRVDAVSHPNHTPHLIPLKSVASPECLGRAVAGGTWVVVVIVHGKSTNQGIYW